MACYFPIKAWRANSLNPTGKTSLVFNSHLGNPNEILTIPCGQCIGCRLEKSRQWAVRCINEASLYKNNCFITLTYDDHTLPVYRSRPLSKGSQWKRDYVLFMKQLRKQYGAEIKFFHCGEYGDEGSRPHHHACLFNHQFPDQTLWSKKSGVPLYVSKSLQKLWPYGFSSIGFVTFESAAYVARYVTKKITGSQAKEHYRGNPTEYITMSRRPGIGKKWFDKYKSDVLQSDSIIIRNDLQIKPPRYYDKIYDSTNPEQMEVIKAKRLSSVNFEEQTYQRLAVKHKLLLSRKQLLRELENFSLQ